MNILIVDDEPLIRRSLEKAFQRRDCKTRTAEDGERGLAMWKEARPDILFLDVLMPGKSGPDVLAEIDDSSQSLVALMSAYTGEYDKDSASQLGADVFYPKPFDNILALVDEAIDLYKKKVP